MEVKATKEFLKKFNNVVLNLKAPKNQRNAFGGFNYRSCEDIQEGVKKAIKELKYDDIISYCSDEVVVVGARYYVKATACFTDGENTITAYGYAREPEARTKMDEAQVTGSSSSYARKYALNGLYSIDDTSNEIDARDNTKNPNAKSFDYKTAIANCKSKEELMSIWNAHPELQKVADFTATLTNKKNELN